MNNRDKNKVNIFYKENVEHIVNDIMVSVNNRLFNNIINTYIIDVNLLRKQNMCNIYIHCIQNADILTKEQRDALIYYINDL